VWPIVFVSAGQDFAARKFSSENDMPSEEWTAAVENRPLMCCVRLRAARGPYPQPHILTSLDEDGLLNIP
jgi:hypothetical protein